MPFVEELFPDSLIFLDSLCESSLEISQLFFLVTEKIPGGKEIVFHHVAIILCESELFLQVLNLSIVK